MPALSTVESFTTTLDSQICFSRGALPKRSWPGHPAPRRPCDFSLDNGLGNGLDGPQGLADSAQWVTGAANPTGVPSFADNWNITLVHDGLLEYLEGPDRTSLFFANLPEVKAALDTVFVAGDYTGNGIVDAADYSYWRSTFGSINLLAADGNNDGVVNAADYVVWRKHWSAPGIGSTVDVPEPASAALVVVITGVLLHFRAPLAAGNGAVKQR